MSAEASEKTSLAAVVAAMGIVFGDIATSPLYTLQECLGPHGVAPRADNVLGCVSLIIWSLLLVVTLKYVVVLMRADNRGEGGILALLALVPRSLRERGAGVLSTTTVLVLIGAAFLFGDGIITPAISVLSAVEGLKIAAPGLEAAIVPLTVVILVGLFAIQSRGSGGLGRYFGPVMALWLANALVLGLIQIVRRPEVLAALSPHHAVAFFLRERFGAFRALGGVVLAVTGGEALYADMGHFGRRPIQLGWLWFALPALAANYLGQGALLLGQPELQQPFYAMVPAGSASIPFVLLGTAATVIASQALISGVFSLTYQSIRLGYFPRLTVQHTSHESIGQIYVPLMNGFLAVSSIGLVLAFRESERLAAAYGLAVSATMAVTSIAFYQVACIRFGWSRLAAGSLVGGFLVMDLAFLGANMLKFFHGGYIPVIVSAGFVLTMLLWTRGRGLLRVHYEGQSEPTGAFLAGLQGRIRGRIPGVGVVMTSLSESIPPVLLHVVRRFGTLHETVLLTTVTTEELPYVTGERATVEPLGAGLHRVTLRYGFMEEPHVHVALAGVLDRIVPGADAGTLTYVLGHERVAGGTGGSMGPLSEKIFAVLHRNASNPSDYFELPATQVVEVGARIDL